MIRHLFILLLLTLSHIITYAQIDTINVSGQVHCGTEYVEGCIVVMLQPSDSSIVAYATTNRQGRYSMHASTQFNEMLVKVTGFNIKQQVTRIKTCSQTLNFNVENESIMLREVLIKSQKLWGSRDTLNYLVSAYTREHDRTIGDVLRQLPGITVEDNGVIRYQGTPINHFYIENLDMLQGRYNLATQGVKAEDVATVQVLENHEHIRALQDQEPAERAAINLKLKDKAKGVWINTATLGAGGYSDGPLWDATLQTMYFNKSRQHLIRYSGDNMGRGYDVNAAHYGISSDGSPRMVDIVRHGSPPVGNGIFGNRHGVSLNNLAKLSDSATVNYNFNYSYNHLRGNSFSQITYILPDGNGLLLTEDITDCTHTNSANLQLTYEKNAERRFFNNTLSIFGQWIEGRGNILSSRSNKTSLSEGMGEEISQALHYRSLGLTNCTRTVYRTAKGGGFEWTSTNSLSTTPQALAISGKMIAHQDINITSISTINNFKMLRDLRAHNWTLSTSAYLNTSYTTLTSELAHPNALIATHGDMDYLLVNVGIGPLVQYARGTFQSTLRLPITLSYTSLDNTVISGEETDGKRVRLGLQPSFSLLWKANNKFTFNANANYSMSETPWPRLLTACIMQNYRSLSRYRVTLNDNYSAGVHVKVSFKDIFNGLFAYLESGWIRAWSGITYGTTLDAQAYTIIDASYMPNHSNNYSFTAYGRKDIDWHTMQIEFSTTGSYGKSEILRQSVLTTYRTIGYILRGTLAFDIASGYRVDYSTTWQHSHSHSANYALTYTELNQRVQLNLRLLPSRLFLNLNASHTRNSSLASGKKDYIFIGGGLQFKMSKKVEVDIDGNNLTNIHSYITRSFGDMEEYYTEYHLRPMAVTLTAHIYI